MKSHRPICLGIGASPRSGGNTDLLLASAIKGAEAAGAEIRTFFLREMTVSPCVACDACHRNGECSLNDGFQQLYPQLLQADLIILAAPIYSLGLNAQAKALVDRCQCFWAKKYVLKQQAQQGKNHYTIFLSAGGADLPDLFDCALRTVRYFADIIGAPLAASCLAKKSDEKGAILLQPELLAHAEQISSEQIKRLRGEVNV